MQQKDDEGNKKQPIEMTTDEALEYCFGPEIAEELKRETGNVKPSCETDESE